jgi:hypothetical protein
VVEERETEKPVFTFLMGGATLLAMGGIILATLFISPSSPQGNERAAVSSASHASRHTLTIR